MNPVDRTRLPALGPEPPFTFPEIEKSTFPSGLRLWTIEHRALPVLSFLLLVPAGAAADPAERPGLAALAADLLDEGSGERSALEVHEALASIGAQFDIETGPDATIVSLTTLSRFGRPALTLLAEMVARPRLEAREVDRVRDLRLHRLLQLRDQPSAVADRVFLETLYPAHPYGHLAIGTEESLRATSLDDLVAFHRRYHVPGAATLIAIGDASHGELANASGEAFGQWEAAGAGAEVPVPAAPARPLAGAPHVVLVHRPGAEQSELRIGHVAAPRATPDYHALIVLNMSLGGQFISRINLNLRERKGYTYGARSVFDFRRGPGPFMVQTAVQTDATADAIGEIVRELREVRGERPITAEEVGQAVAAITRGYPRGFETTDQIARGTAQIALYGLPDDYFSRFADRVAAVGPDDVADAAGRQLDPGRLVAVVVGDGDRIGASLAGLDESAAAVGLQPNPARVASALQQDRRA